MTAPPADLDKSGNPYQRVRINLGPTLGWYIVNVQPLTQLDITVAGTFVVSAGVNLIMVNVAGLVTVQLPDVTLWVQQSLVLDVSTYQGALWIKDLGGHAAAFNITVTPFGTQKIDNLAQSFTLVQNRQLLRLYPLSDLSGWFSG